MAIASVLGFPRIGSRRELKKAVEVFWKGEVTEDQLQRTAQDLRHANWRLQREHGIEHIPANDFSLYDQVLDTTAMLGAIPERFSWRGNTVDLDTYFAMARGNSGAAGEADIAPLEMTKWFDTNYHYLVPEFTSAQNFRLASQKPIEEFEEAKQAGVLTRPVLIGPLTYLLLGKCLGEPFDRLSLLDRVLPVYEQVLQAFSAAGAQWIQIDEPALVLDLEEEVRSAFQPAYERLSASAPELSILVATYFGELAENLETACRLPIAGLHVDLVHGAGQLEAVLSTLPGAMHLSLGLVDGRNIWRTDLDKALSLARQAELRIGPDRMLIAPSCSLLHCPLDLDLEETLDGELRSWLAFATQKLDEIALLTRALNEGEATVAQELAANREAMASRGKSRRVHQPEVRSRTAAVTLEMLRRPLSYAERARLQREKLKLPLLPTTTIGSFPQTREVRRARADFKAGRIDTAEYEQFIQRQIEETVRFQEEIGLDVLVHGEAERNDMVEYFGEQLEGFAFTRHGWVQSYGSRCVKPPIIYGDVSRPRPMTVQWLKYAQALSPKPVKGMLTGPVTILQWSFVRNDQPYETTCRQIALAIRDEVADLEAAGISMIQIDEAALREGLPLRKRDWAAYLEWAVESFRLASSGVRNDTQIHTHMCYSEFHDIFQAITEMDADVISIESSRSRMELLQSFEDFDYPNEIGPGIYDIHSPRVPSREEMASLLRLASHAVKPERLWANPDCGLKTRGWPEVRESLANMVHAAQEVRAEF